MNMTITITENEKEYKFTASAVTNILYKRLFGIDPENYFRGRAEMLRDPRTREDLKKAKEVATLPEDDPKRLEISTELADNANIFDLANGLTEFAKQYGFICYVQANTPAQEVFKTLTMENYILWLLDFDEGFFKTHAGEIKQLHDGNNRTDVKRKNPIGQPTEK